MNLKRYEKDLADLIDEGDRLYLAMQKECFPESTVREAKKALGEKAKETIEKLPSFRDEYQTWYSEAVVLLRQLLPERLTDFTRHYEKPKSRKNITNESYTIEDYLQGITVGPSYDPRVRFDAAIPRFQQQLSMVKSIGRRFESSLFDIRQLAQADLFDSELEAAQGLAKNGFNRAAGVVAGVVLERHLKEVCINHGIKIRKKAPAISDLNDTLKNENVIQIPDWRFIQHLGDVRNVCGHAKDSEPTQDQVKDLINGVTKVTKTVF